MPFNFLCFGELPIADEHELAEPAAPSAATEADAAVVELRDQDEELPLVLAAPQQKRMTPTEWSANMHKKKARRLLILSKPRRKQREGDQRI